MQSRPQGGKNCFFLTPYQRAHIPDTSLQAALSEYAHRLADERPDGDLS